MKLVKYFLFLIVSFMMLYDSQATANDQVVLWEDLKKKFPVLYESRDPADINNDFADIEKSLFVDNSQHKIPEILKELHRQTHNLAYSGMALLSVKRGSISHFYNHIRDTHEKGLGKEWLVFAELAGNEYYCINHHFGNIQLVTLIPRIQYHQPYANLEEWIRSVVLRI